MALRGAAARHESWLAPDWADRDGVGALMTTRQGGVGLAPFDTLNLRNGLGDDPQAVARNQHIVASAAAAVPVYLNQVHGVRVVRLTSIDAQPRAPVHTADAAITTEPGIACTAQVADCLPVLFAAPGARGVGAAHAGWRGLAAGVLEATLAALCDAAACRADDLRVWLGPCIGPGHFEVGADVLAAFDASGASPRFIARAAPGKWLADLPGLARDRLQAAGVREISAAGACTAADASRFFSFRRDGVTGRMAALVWIEAGQRR